MLPIPGTRSGPHPQDPDPATLHPRMVLPEKVPAHARRGHRHPEELPCIQRKEEVPTNENR